MEAAFASNWTAGPAHRTLCCGASAWLLPGRSFFGSVAGLQPAPQTIARARLLPRGPGMMAALACSCSTVTAVCAPAWGCTHFFLNCQNRLSEQANLDSKLKVEVCVRTGTKFVSEQGLRLNVRVSPWRLGGRAGCVLIESVRGSEGDFKTGRGKERGNWECQSP